MQQQHRHQQKKAKEGSSEHLQQLYRLIFVK
jgi:hypothetical protein